MLRWIFKRRPNANRPAPPTENPDRIAELESRIKAESLKAVGAAQQRVENCRSLEFQIRCTLQRLEDQIFAVGIGRLSTQPGRPASESLPALGLRLLSPETVDYYGLQLRYAAGCSLLQDVQQGRREAEASAQHWQAEADRW